MSKTTDIVLSASAVAAALSALSQVSSQNADLAAMGDGHTNKILTITDAQTPHQGAIDAILANSSVQVELRKSMGIILPAMDVDKDTMEDTWIRLASGAGDLIGPNQDSVLDDRMGNSGLTTCYTNCHSACHGSRGWR